MFALTDVPGTVRTRSLLLFLVALQIHTPVEQFSWLNHTWMGGCAACALAVTPEASSRLRKKMRRAYPRLHPTGTAFGEGDFSRCLERIDGVLGTVSRS